MNIFPRFGNWLERASNRRDAEILNELRAQVEDARESREGRIWAIFRRINDCPHTVEWARLASAGNYIAQPCGREGTSQRMCQRAQLKYKEAWTQELRARTLVAERHGYKVRSNSV